MAQCKRCAAGDQHEFKHNLSGYTYHRCRCDECRAYATSWARRSRLSKADWGVRCKRCHEGQPHEFEHGPGGYDYHACRCQICRSGQNEKVREFRAKNPGYAAEADRSYMLRSGQSVRADYKKRNREYIRTRNKRIAATRSARTRNSATRVGRFAPSEDAVIATAPSLVEAAYQLGRSLNSVRGRQRRLLTGGLSCFKCRKGISHTIPHGTHHGYLYHGCRCEECRAANSEVCREYYQKRHPVA